jgi:hypothetical protein
MRRAKHIPKLGGEASRSEAGGGLFKDESTDYKVRSGISVKSALRADFEQTAPVLATLGHPRLT